MHDRKQAGELHHETYDLDDAVIDRIEFLYNIKVGNKGDKKLVNMCEGSTKLEGVIREHDDPAEPSRALTLSDLIIKVYYHGNDTIKMDVNCDSAYMLAAMDCVGKSIRAAYHWVPATEPCYLVMDNVGGYRIY